MIGHLQKNKVKYIIPFIHLIHSVDSIKLLEVISSISKKNDDDGRKRMTPHDTSDHFFI